MRKRFQGISLEQQRKTKAKKKKKNQRVVGRRRESGVSGIFSSKVSRTPSSVSAAARRNPFGMQVILLGFYILKTSSRYRVFSRTVMGIETYTSSVE